MISERVKELLLVFGGGTAVFLLGALLKDFRPAWAGDEVYDLGTRVYGSWSLTTTRTWGSGPLVITFDNVKTGRFENIVCIVSGPSMPYSCVRVAE